MEWRFTMKNLIIGMIALLALYVLLPTFGINTSYLVPRVIEWATMFVLPWIILYWFIRLVKSFENK